MKLYISELGTAARDIVADDMILTTDMPTCAGSKMLDGYKSLFEAEAVTRLRDAKYSVYGKANTGELGLDLLGETSYYGACADEEGKLTNAVAEIVKAEEARAGLTLEVNGSSARAAALSSLTYIKPTYGTVSRYGTIPAVCSGETVSVTAKGASICREILSALAGHDDKDGTSLPQEKCALLKADAPRDSVKKIAVAKALLASVDDETAVMIGAYVEKARKNGIEVAEIDAEELRLARPAWNILMSAEVCNNVSRYDGVKFGYRSMDSTNIDDLYTNSRTEAFGYLLKSVILFGSDVLSTERYMDVYDKALRIRRVVSDYMNSVLEGADAILLPACSRRSYTEEEVKKNPYIAYDESLYTAPVLIPGLPAVVTEGVQIVGKALADNSLLDLAELLERGGER